MRIALKKIYVVLMFSMILATRAANCAAQVAHAAKPASGAAKPDFGGCIDCVPSTIPTLPQWCAIAMGLILIGLTLFLMRRSKAPANQPLRRGTR
jgi:hypothetical protein